MDDAFRLCHCQQVADGVSIVDVYFLIERYDIFSCQMLLST